MLVSSKFKNKKRLNNVCINQFKSCIFAPQYEKENFEGTQSPLFL